MRPGLWTSVLVYGPPNGGKTEFITSAFYNHITKKIIRNGKLIAFGREYSSLLDVPKEFVVRLTAPTLSSLRWVDEFRDLMNTLIGEAQKGQHLDVLGFDGFSEFDLLYEEAYTNVNDPNRKDKFARYEALMATTLGILQRVDPSVLGCHFLASARVMDRRRASRTRGGAEIPGDPEYVNADYYPAFRGTFRHALGHYFDFTLYMEEEMGIVTEGPYAGKELPAHILHLIREGDYLIKNRMQREWLAKGLPFQLVNAQFDDLMELIQKATEIEETKHE